MGMFDTVIIMDDELQCPHGHVVTGFQTKSLHDPSMATYLLVAAQLYRAERGWAEDDEHSERWQIDGDHAVFTRRHLLEPVAPPRDIEIYSHCDVCAPVLVRTDRALFGDIVDERRLYVDFRITFRRGEPRQIERMSGTRDDLIAELREQGLRVLREDEPLAIAHREIQAAREERPHPSLAPLASQSAAIPPRTASAVLTRR